MPKDLWGDPDTNAGGGVWYPPSFDDEGFMYFGTGNPAPFLSSPGMFLRLACSSARPTTATASSIWKALWQIFKGAR